ncbi:hypothetical protein QNO07_17415 [Streptomyces sp. 549]|uniref:hypothetical protein n=1 Tax=Streptomyces sp. 549 TaxID=3049076 RepID=UPI0024C3C342|nr:hypothetical protein [Streptomyces sp. 549]MDK1475173.1 hypothetical protein [Streptomyces sp. 549]
MAEGANAGDGSPSGASIRLEADALKTFKSRVDGILQRLEASPASRKKISDQRVAKASYGSGFVEADALYLQYEQVHSHLTKLSKTFSDQIEALGIAARGVDVGFDNLEESEKRRFWEIQERTAHNAERTSSQPEQGATGGERPGGGTRSVL